MYNVNSFSRRAGQCHCRAHARSTIAATWRDAQRGAPAFVTWLQFASTAVAVRLASTAGWVETDAFEWCKLKHFAVYVLAFSGGTWSNMHVLMTANVETVIVFRACAPLAVSVFDYAFHKRALPSARSCAGMLVIVAGALGYVSTDNRFLADGLAAYFWVLVWWGLLVFQLTYGKHLVSNLGIKSAWSAVLYTNTLSLLPTLLIGVLGAPTAARARRAERGSDGHLVGRLQVIGVLNKMLTVLLNTLMWEHHASAMGARPPPRSYEIAPDRIASLAACLAGGALYRQAPLRKEAEARYEPLPQQEATPVRGGRVANAQCSPIRKEGHV
ncbi:hypothetical protein EMIHUDRAFT_232014 [Emiliania huxleyi CCMP1516]|uniref:Sugar phosphate transporter domain-containing protein n=2 Tax=Emiliania huxleyi TaxID=2903 RepID=A0A0D3K6M5_EMIH1|nr:hypothetical protein EMIHUDRAFT_232014 [Emiliania huxleyi CCMP1516]EOD31410.1 hypothetical protein EMIHUDRAFT_232014 [Emiliania huxleyi CCMP1516]|eukprot:XP_005783839.1 hypothetical protein EMIHUDRAFT_232014 [Emiliania huxleyi CCMP1516]